MELPPSSEPSTGYGQQKSSLMERLLGIITFKAPIYKEIAEDQDATGIAAVIVVVVAIFVGFVSGLFQTGQINAQFADQGVSMDLNPLVAGVFGAVIQPVFSLIGWGIGSWLLALIASKFFEGKTNTSEMLRVLGFTYIFNILGIIPCVGIVGWVLSIVGAVIGIREAAEFDTGKAVLTVVIEIAIIIGIFILLFACLFFAIFALAAGASG
jgi:hypothetical protein